MAFISRGERILKGSYPEDRQDLHENYGKLRSFTPNVDPRSWSLSAFVRHQYLLEVVMDKERDQKESNEFHQEFSTSRPDQIKIVIESSSVSEILTKEAETCSKCGKQKGKK